jgi:hypothetical protein
MSIQRLFSSAAAILAFGFTASAQQPVVLNTSNATLVCKSLLPENYPMLPDEIRGLTGEGAMACIRSINERAAARHKVEDAGDKLAAAIDDRKATTLDIIRLKLNYLNAFAGVYAADEAMHGPNFQATLRYFDVYVARKKAGNSFDDATQDAYGKWQAAMLAAERHVGPDKQLLASAKEAQRVREAAETAEFKKAIDGMEEMMKQDREMMQHDKEMWDKLFPPVPTKKQ